jgi:hypothetical protein
MSQLAVLGSRPRRVIALAPVGPATAIFEPVPITPLAPFGDPPLRLVLDEHHERGRREAAELHTRTSPSVRLTRRGRVVAIVLLAVVATAVLLALGLVPSQASTAPASAHPAAPFVAAGSVLGGVTAAVAAGSVVVQPGDTLWSIATRIAPRVDPRATVQKIIDRNALSGAAVQAGQLLILPS